VRPDHHHGRELRLAWTLYLTARRQLRSGFRYLHTGIAECSFRDDDIGTFMIG
jgi:hypothetical protein